MKIKKYDIVEVIAGKYRGKSGKVLQVFPRTQRLRVEGVNLLKKHVKSQQQNSSGQIVETLGTIHVSNVMFVDSETSSRTKISYKMIGDKKVRYSRKFNKEL